QEELVRRIVLAEEEDEEAAGDDGIVGTVRVERDRAGTGEVPHHAGAGLRIRNPGDQLTFRLVPVDVPGGVVVVADAQVLANRGGGDIERADEPRRRRDRSLIRRLPWPVGAVGRRSRRDTGEAQRQDAHGECSKSLHRSTSHLWLTPLGTRTVAPEVGATLGYSCS